MQLKDFKIRASAVGQIMTNPRTKAETLSQTCITYLQTWIKEQIYSVQYEVKSKYLTKGLDVESVAIDYYAEQMGLGFVLPNTDFFSCNFCMGTPDLIHDGIVYDLKSSWDCFTFPLFDTEPDKKYYGQLQIYMHLTELKKAKLVYTLQNTPDELEWSEPKDYSNIAAKYRIKEFEFDYDPEYILAVSERVELCQEYINQITAEL
jgi:hypothetical protein